MSAVCDTNPDIAKGVATSLGVPSIFSSISDMLARDRPDIIDICTQPQVHKDIAIQAMEAGCNVLVEKPMAISVGDCEEMIRCSEKNGVKLAVVHNQKFYPPFLKAQQLIKNGEIGKVTGVRILNFTHKKAYTQKKEHWVHQLPGGVMAESGPHAVYMSIPFIGNVLGVNVQARKTQAYPWVSFDTFSVQLEGASSSSDMTISHAGDYFSTEVDIFGSEAMIRMDLQSMLLDLQKRKSLSYSSLVESSLKTSRRIAFGVFSNALSSTMGKTFLGHDVIVKKFVKCIIDDSPPPVSGKEGMETVSVMERIVSQCRDTTGREGNFDPTTTIELDTISLAPTKD